MAIQVIRTFPEFPRNSQTVALGNRNFRLRFTYRGRTDSWYLDVFDVQNNPIVLARRITAFWSPLFGVVDDEIPGVLFVVGPDDANRFDLGGRLKLLFVPFADLPEAVPVEDAPVITIV